jgi:hypothetical protein
MLVRLSHHTLTVLFAVALALLVASATAFAASVSVVQPSQAAAQTGKTYGQWSAAWWQYVLSFPATSANPGLDTTGAGCQNGQSGDVFFLVGSFVGPVDRTECGVPGGKFLFFPLINFVAVATEPSDTEASLRAQIARCEDKAKTLHASVDGVVIDNLNPHTTPFRTLSPVFSVTLPGNNLAGLAQGTYSPAVGDGYYLLLAPLATGAHTLSFGGTDGCGNTQDITYHLTVR